MAKQALTQRAFHRGQPRPDLLEGDDLEIRATSCKGAENVRVEANRGLAPRHGSTFIVEKPEALDVVEIRPTSTTRFALVYGKLNLWVLNEDGTEEFATADEDVPWFDSLGLNARPQDIWVEPYRNKTIIGGAWGLWELVYNGGSWVFQTFKFDPAPGGELAQPYWAFEPNTTITPSALTGSITVTASTAVFSADYVGVRIRYNYREILITAFTSSTVVTGTVASDLPPSYRLTLDSVAGFKAGDVVIGQDTDFQGLIVTVNTGSSYIDVVTLEFYEGPDVGEKVASSNNSSEVTAKATVTTLASPIWDEQLMSVVRGYPRGGASAAGRLCLVDFPLVPDLVVLSSSRAITDMKVGAEDDDAIARQVGDNAPRFLHAVNAGDLLLFANRGCYLINIRGGNPVTPSTFNPVLFDARGADEVRPALLDGSVIFVEVSRRAVSAAMLDGNVNLKWNVKPLTTLYSDLIINPVKVCGPALNSPNPERYLFIVNNDGSMATMSWFSDFAPDAVGFVPWNTTGDYKAVSPCFDTYWLITNRGFRTALDAQDTKKCIEALDIDARTDCEVAIEDAVLFRFLTPTVYAGNWDLGDLDADVDGEFVDQDEFPDDCRVGFGFTSTVSFWPQENVDTRWAGMKPARLIRGSVSMYETGIFQVRCNNTTKYFGGYTFADPLDEPPPDRTKVFKFTCTGRRDHPEIVLTRDRPYMFHVMALTQEVQV